MSALSVIGALLVIAGVVQLAWAAIAQGRLSDRRPNPEDTVDVTLEPRQKGLGFLAPSANWPGQLLILLGGAVLLLPAIL